MSAPDLDGRFYDEWIAMSRRLGVSAYDLARVSFAETGMFRRHPSNPNAGVWPFIESTLHRLGWPGSAFEFTALPPADQLPYMERYLQPYARFLRDDAMVYVAMFLPSHLSRALQEGDAHVMTARGDGTGFYDANPILDRNGDGAITVGDLRRHLDIQDQGARWRTIEQELAARGAGGSRSLVSSARRNFVPLALAVSALGAWYLYLTPAGRQLRKSAEREIGRLA